MSPIAFPIRAMEHRVLARTDDIIDTDPTLRLLDRIRTGDAAAFGELLSEHYDTIFRAAWKWCGNRADAEDIAQDVCVKLATAIKSFDGRSSIATWIYTITLNAVRDRIRSASRRRRRDEAILRDTDPTVGPNQEQAVASAQLWAAVRTLPEKQRDAVILVHAEDLSHAEAGRIMGCAEATVSVHLHSARKTLRGIL